MPSSSLPFFKPYLIPLMTPQLPPDPTVSLRISSQFSDQYSTPQNRFTMCEPVLSQAESVPNLEASIRSLRIGSQFVNQYSFPLMTPHIPSKSPTSLARKTRVRGLIRLMC